MSAGSFINCFNVAIWFGLWQSNWYAAGFAWAACYYLAVLVTELLRKP